MFENMFLLNLPAINLNNVNLLYPETNYERAMKSPFCVCGENVGDEECLRELWEERVVRSAQKMKEMVRGR